MHTDAFLRRTYGITLPQWQALYEAQGGRCAICKRKPRSHQPELAVDHRHSDGLVRGLLCGWCNRELLGYFHEDTERFLNAVSYLLAPPAAEVIGHHYTPDSIGAVEGPQ